MNKTTCTNCKGDGLYHAPTSHGPYCFRCKGTGQVTNRPARAAKVITLSATVRISDRCAGDPTKLSTDNTAALKYLGLTIEDLLNCRQLWTAGVREIAR